MHGGTASRSPARDPVAGDAGGTGGARVADEAVRPDGPLTGWRLSHGLVVLSGSGAVALDNIAAEPPLPPVLLYAPSPTSSPEDWLDFDGPDGPYRLVGWAYAAPYENGSLPPRRQCSEDSEWFVHEAGWHTTDGGMQLTADATAEPDPPAGVDALFWHPRIWDVHFWAGDDGVPTIAFNNPNARAGGLRLADGAFYQIVNDRKELLRMPGG